MNGERQEHRHAPTFTHQVLPVLISAIFVLAPAVLVAYLAQSSNEETETIVDYREAAEQARWPDPRFVSTSLVGFKFDHPVTVVTWTQKRWVSSYQQSDPAKTGKDIWVTEVPFLKAFCQEYVRLHGADGDQLALRLKEHLGLPPDADYDTFVELAVDPKDNGARLFRPCGDASLETTTCKPPTPPATSDAWLNPSGNAQSQDEFKDEIREWMLRNYYSNYANQDPYPWTALGYTFDWARKGDSDDFERYGESEFVIPKGTPVHFVSAASTMAYCTPP